jgi:hypothetical protein
MFVDLIPPGTHDPTGIHGALWQRFMDPEYQYDLPSAESLTLVSYAAGTKIEAFIEHLAIGASLPDMPLFLNPQRYVNVPLEKTYQAAFEGMPKYWRNVLEAKPAS